ncbi:MAG: hypothetical protein Q9196_006577, partial [Gyalolechia fulgens]
FLAAKLHVDALSTKTSVRMLKRALENLSSNLNELYDDALSRIESQNEDYRQLAEKALRWVAYTYQRFPVRALQEALAIDPDETDFDDEAITPIGLILDVCAGLLALDEENGVVRLVHYTAQDYFDTVQSKRFNNVHATIACDCVTYLSYDCFQHAKGLSSHGTEGGDYLAYSPVYFFLWYASFSWAEHAKMANRDAHLSTRIHQFLAGNPRVILDKNATDEYYCGTMHPCSLETSHGLEIAVFFGLCDLLEGLFKDTGEAAALTDDDLNLLHLAAENDQAGVIHVLLDHSADIERRDHDGYTPLHRAILSSALEAATALVNRGADVMAETAKSDLSRDSPLTPFSYIPEDSRHLMPISCIPGDPHHLTPISCIPGVSSSEFLELLLGAGAKIQTRDIFDETPLMRNLINMKNSQTAEKIFKQHSVEQPREKEISSRALCYALRRGATDMVDLLLRYGADSNSHDVQGQTALHVALDMGNIDQVNRLSAYGADFQAQGWQGRTSLHYAAMGGNKDCLLAVLCSGADINWQDEFGMTALHFASKEDSPACIEVLLAQGANIEAQDRFGKTPLVLAAEKGNKDCVLTLLRNGANANAQNESALTALHTASFAALDTHDGCREVQVIVLRACSLEHLWVLRYLLLIWKKVLEIRVWNEGMTALDLAVLDQESRVWSEGMTALDLAVLDQHDKIVRLLENSAQSAIESDSVAIDRYLFNFLGVSSAKEADEELDRRLEDEQEREDEERQQRRCEVEQLLRSLEEELSSNTEESSDERSEREEKLKEDESPEEKENLWEEQWRLEKRLAAVLKRIPEGKRRSLREKREIWLKCEKKLDENKRWEAAVKKEQ